MLDKDEKTEVKIQDIGGEIVVKHHRRIVNSVNGVKQVMLEGNRARKFGETNMNQQSSRSHTIFRIVRWNENGKSSCNKFIFFVSFECRL